MRLLAMGVAAATAMGIVAGGVGPVTATTVPAATGEPIATLEAAGGVLGKVVAERPVAWTPHIRDGAVWAITQTGDTMVVGGNFTRVAVSKDSPDISRTNLMSFDAVTGRINDFSPSTDGRVAAVTPGNVPGTVYVAGSFKSLNGRTGRVFLLDAKTGKVLDSFSPATIDGPVVDLALVGNRLYIGGTFTYVGGAPHAGIASLYADTGQVDPHMNIQMQGNHNWTPGSSGGRGFTGPMAFDISPDGSTMAVVGNFKTVDGLDLDQAFLADLSGETATIADWHTDRYDDPCKTSYDSYVRDVKWSPDGRSFTIAATGAPHPGTLCDTIATWLGAERGRNLEPIAIDESGGDSLYSVAHTDAVVYAGGHIRWANNPNGEDSAKPGAVPRPSLTGDDPRGLLPIDWNPGRVPRGVGITVMYATPAGVWMGSDTDWYGNFEYRRPRLAMFPVDGGRALATRAIQGLPAYYYRIADSGVQRYFTDGRTIGDGEGFPAGTLSGGRVRGAFVVGGTLFYGSTDGYLYRRAFDGVALGPEEKIDPYNDPKWSDVATGTGSTVFRGEVPQLYDQLSSQINGMEAKDNTLYFTRPGDDGLYRTGFSADSGIVEAFPRLDGVGTAVPGSPLIHPGDFVFVAGDIVYVNTATGSLMTAPMSDNGVGTSRVLDDSRDYRGTGLFLGGGPGAAAPNNSPTAYFAASCTGLACDFDAGSATDPDGEIVEYAWDFGDGSTADGPTASHRYAAAGYYSVTLTVTDDSGALDVENRGLAVATSGPPAPVTTPPEPPAPVTKPPEGSVAPPAVATEEPAGQPAPALVRAPGKVRKLVVSKATRRTVKLKYRKSPRAERYKFWAKPTKGKKKWKSKGTTTKAKFKVSKLKPSTRYRIKVVAKNSAGPSPKAVIKVKTR